MNYDQYLNQLIASLGVDKSIPQPYRNSVTSTARRLQLEIRGAQTMTSQTPPPGVDVPVNPSCTCAAGVVNRSCPVHGAAVK